MKIRHKNELSKEVRVQPFTNRDKIEQLLQQIPLNCFVTQSDFVLECHKLYGGSSREWIKRVCRLFKLGEPTTSRFQDFRKRNDVRYRTVIIRVAGNTTIKSPFIRQMRGVTGQRTILINATCPDASSI
jgi:hypothetical protein